MLVNVGLLTSSKCKVEIAQEGDVAKTVNYAVREAQIRNGGRRFFCSVVLFEIYVFVWC